MEFPNILIFSALTLLLIIAFLFMCKKVRKDKSSINAFAFVIMGLFICMSGSFAIFFTLDTTKGWNPFGWWFLATFISTVIGGLAGLLVYSTIAGRTPSGDFKNEGTSGTSGKKGKPQGAPQFTK